MTRGRRDGLLYTLAAVAWLIVAFGATGDDASARPAHRAPVVAPRISSTGVCGGVLAVQFDTIQLAGTTWIPLMDDGTARLEIHEVSGRSGPAGVWETAPTTSGGEHRLRWSGWVEALQEGQHFDSVRVVVGGYTSMSYPISQECP